MVAVSSTRERLADEVDRLRRERDGLLEQFEAYRRVVKNIAQATPTDVGDVAVVAFRIAQLEARKLLESNPASEGVAEDGAASALAGATPPFIVQAPDNSNPAKGPR
jgi:hypothetical protein